MIFFCLSPLTLWGESSIIGLTLEREAKAERKRTEAREAAGKIEGIGDVLSDGPRKFLGSQIYGKQDRLFENQ